MGDKYNIKEGIQKFPSFHYKALTDLISKKEIFQKEETVNSLIELKNLFLKLEKEIINLVETNFNNFNDQCKSYNQPTYYYIIASQLNITYCDSILYKLGNKNEEKFKFNYNEYIQSLKNKYGNNNDFENKLKKINPLIEVIDKIINSEHNIAISFLNIIFNYLICFVKEILTQIESFKKMKIDNKFSYNLDNEESLLNLIVYLEKLYTLCIFLGSYYFIEENDIFNQDINSEN